MEIQRIPGSPAELQTSARRPGLQPAGPSGSLRVASPPRGCHGRYLFSTPTKGVVRITVYQIYEEGANFAFRVASKGKSLKHYDFP